MIEPWFKSICFYLDQSIKTFDKAFYNRIEHEILKNGFTILNSLDFIKSKSLFSIKVVSSELSKRTNSPSSDYSMLLCEPNMNLFSSTSADHNPEIDLLFYKDEDFKQKLKLIHFASKKSILKLEDEFLSQSIRMFKKRGGSSSLKLNTLSKEELKLLDLVETDIYGALSLQQIRDVLAAHSKQLNIDLLILSPSEMFNHQADLFYPLEIENKHIYFVVNTEPSSLLDIYIFQTVVEASKRLNIKKTGENIRDDLEEVFSKIPIPIAVFDNEQQLILHNSHFIKLNYSVTKTLELKVNDQVTIGEEVYKVQKVFLDNSAYIHVNFIPVREFLGQSTNPSSEEMGIVSSSIAHELNNPLAGILAALNVLELDDDSSEDILAKYQQMRDGIMRCKKLVETFLSFSKINQGEYDHSIEIKESLTQAMELIRFRLIENNITINSEYFKEEKFNKEINPYIMSMVFYLFLGELLTNFSHQKLITMKSSQQIKLNFFEGHDSFSFELADGLKIPDSFMQSKLIQHLLTTQKLHLAHKDNRYTFL